jgi:hypothetical protein
LLVKTLVGAHAWPLLAPEKKDGKEEETEVIATVYPEVYPSDMPPT